jgi:hypothetical protein
MLATSNLLAGTKAEPVLEGTSPASPHYMRSTLYACFLVALLFSAACGEDDPPTAPTNPPLNLTGTWRGTINVSGVTTNMTWTLTQTGTGVAGPVVIALPTGAVIMNGALTGTLSGSTLSYTIGVAPGGLPTQPACSGQIAGVTTVTGSSAMNGTYSVASSTCTTGLTNGTFALTR